LPGTFGRFNLTCAGHCWPSFFSSFSCRDAHRERKRFRLDWRGAKKSCALAAQLWEITSKRFEKQRPPGKRQEKLEKNSEPEGAAGEGRALNGHRSTPGKQSAFHCRTLRNLFLTESIVRTGSIHNSGLQLIS
jgi:hypothetical protein